jgi:hypothetical protein
MDKVKRVAELTVDDKPGRDDIGVFSAPTGLAPHRR